MSTQQLTRMPSDEGATSRARFLRAQQAVFNRYGVQAESRFIDVPALPGRAHVLVAGDGPPVMMVIGGGPPAAFWAPLMAQLDGFTRCAVDLPGMGLTAGTSLSTQGIRAFAVDFLTQVLDGLGLDRAVFVGNSMGGLWSTWLALDRPERAQAVALVACPALILGTSAPLPMRLLSVPFVERVLTRLMPPSERQVERTGRMAREHLSPEIKDVLLACERLPTHAPSRLALLHAVVTPRGARPEVALTADQLRGITQPVQLIWGEDDPFGAPEVGERAAALIPDAELHVVPGGHAPWLSSPERVGALLAPFLGAHSSVALAR